VAWSNFITGKNPGKHGIYDFIHRKPDMYIPYLSTSEAKDADPEDSFVIGTRVVWLKSGEVNLLRKGKPFWENLAESEIYNRVFKIPSNFPPWEGQGWSGSGMGTPDLSGTYGEFTYFTDYPPEHPDAIGGGTIEPVYSTYGVVRTKLRGPKNTFKLDSRKPYTEYKGKGGKRKRIYRHVGSEVGLTIYIDKDSKSAKIEFQDQELLLKEGEWSEFVPIVFELWPNVVEVKGIVRFYLKEVDPYFKLYASPINMDPSDSPLPITSPPEYSQQIAEDIGYYYTQGMPEDTKARQADLDILNDGELFHQMLLIHAEDMKIYQWHLDRWKDGMLFYYFSSLDLGTHMFWRLHDPSHPAHDAEWADKLGDPIEKLYAMMDGVLGMTLEQLADPSTGKLPEDLTLIVMSDHGFASWEKSFQVNSWLLENGYLVLHPDVDQEDVEFFRAGPGYAVDWSRTRAYGIGINGVYINQTGREEYGAVQPSQKKELIDEIVAELLKFEDLDTCKPAAEGGPSTCVRPLIGVAKAYEAYHGGAMDVAPDIVLGFKRGYRGGDDSALGKIPREILSINESSWSGDHCIATSEVPGIVATNRKIKKEDPALIDIGPTVLKIFGLEVPGDMDGRPIF